MNDPVNHPAHYTQSSVETIEITELLGFCAGNAVKYVWRANHKGARTQDLAKAEWYVNRLHAKAPKGIGRIAYRITHWGRARKLAFLLDQWRKDCPSTLQVLAVSRIVELWKTPWDEDLHWAAIRTLNRFNRQSPDQ